ncbi:S8 family peptidase [Paenibacillus senegalensis]|uniref:S8 family peptidase n=1 Tax=Paenibacillus senegalensis TaxID=1465766 RepID=UPI0002894071|nr:S8 family serine peptidase [Paenibacillus senegalensis]
MSFKVRWLFVGIVILLGVVTLPAFIQESALQSPSITKHSTWIIQWKHSKDPAFDSMSKLVNDYPDVNVSVAMPDPRVAEADWLHYWQASEYVEFIQPNHTYSIAQELSDPLPSVPTHLRQIGAEEAWQMVVPQSDLIIAVVDTGVDLNHPDLKTNLVPGVNLITPGSPPMDDHGHGTGVAGVIAAANNKEAGVSGVLWEANIMPIKALESTGNGDEDKLGEGIRYAVDNGAKIVVLSLGLNKPSPYMESIVRYAEERGVLLVAATGNEANAVKFPAAYPTVLAVAGGTPQGADPRSNSGPEVDVMAPWTVYTTRLGGSYGYQEGTSMAAPQVAAVSALLWKENPDWKPYQIRNAIRQSAHNIVGAEWDANSGFGMLRADRAMSLDYRDHLYEGHRSMEQAKPLTISQQISDAVGEHQGENWYVIDSPYDGTLTIAIESNAYDSLSIGHYDSADLAESDFAADWSRGEQIPVTQGKSYLRISLNPGAEEAAYLITTGFLIAPDAFEDNDRQYKAYRLPLRSTTLTGTFHQEEDHDWYSMKIEEPGTLRLIVEVDTARMDPVILIQRQGMREIRVDEYGDGLQEDTGWLDVTPGIYYFRISNIPGYSAPVVGTYTLSVEYEPANLDPNEPDNRSNGSEAEFADIAGHWAEREIKQLTQEGILQGIADNQFAPDRFMTRAQAVAALVRMMDGAGQQSGGGKLAFNDVKPDHWAYPYISAATQRALIQGYEDGSFRPEGLVTRMEMIALLSRAIPLETDEAQGSSRFPDVSSAYWGHSLLVSLHEAGVIDGYEDGSFKPDQPATRAEFVSFLVKWLK